MKLINEMRSLKKENTGYKVFVIFNAVLMALVVLVTLYPVLYIVAQSFSSEQELIKGTVGIIPKGFNINTYKYVLTTNNFEFLGYYKNTIIYTIIGTVLSLVFSATLAYPLSKPELKFNKLLPPKYIVKIMKGVSSLLNLSSGFESG